MILLVNFWMDFWSYEQKLWKDVNLNLICYERVTKIRVLRSRYLAWRSVAGMLHSASFLQAVIVPCGLTVNLPEDEKTKLLDKCKQLEQRLKAAGVRAKGDYRDNYSPGWKFNHWELKVCETTVSPRSSNKPALISKCVNHFSFPGCASSYRNWTSWSEVRTGCLGTERYWRKGEGILGLFSLTKVICCSFHIVKYNFARREMLRWIASKNINNCTLNNRSMKNLFCSCSILNPQRIKEKKLFFFSFVTSSVLSSKLVLRKKFQKLWSVFIPTCTRGNCYMLISCRLQFLISIGKWERARPCCL